MENLTAQQLYDEGVEITSSHYIPPNVVDQVGKTVLNAKTEVKNALKDYRLPVYGGSERVEIEPIDPQNKGLVLAYTDGFKKGVNAFILNGTKWYSNLMKRLEKSNSKFAKYLYRKLRKPLDTLYKSMVHEELHDQTQIHNGFYKNLYKAIVSYVMEKIPVKERAEAVANIFFVPMLEGLNEATTKYVTNEGRNLKEIRSAAREDPTTYGRYTETASEALMRKGYRTPLGFYNEYIRNPIGKAKEYVSGFFKSLFKKPVHVYA